MFHPINSQIDSEHSEKYWRRIKNGFQLYIIHDLNSVSLTVQYFPEHYSQNLNLTLLIESFLSLLFY